MNPRRTFRVRSLALALLLGIAAAGWLSTNAAAASSATAVVNVNTATADELQLLPGVGEARARAILEARAKRGGFRSVDDLIEVKGIGKVGLERIRPHVTLTGKSGAR